MPGFDPRGDIPERQIYGIEFCSIKESAEAPIDSAVPIRRVGGAPRARFHANERAATGTFELRRQSHAPQQIDETGIATQGV